MDVIKKDLEQTGKELGAKIFGIADLELLKEKVPNLLNLVPGNYSRAVVFGFGMQKSVLQGLVDKPTPLYYHNYRQVNYQLDRIALTIADKIQDKGFQALAVPASQVIDRNPMSGHISHKLLGWMAGIGFIGRSTLLVHPEYGAQIRYVSILTDMSLTPSVPYKGDCGDCHACITVCPACAIKEKKEDFNLNACYEKLNEFTRIPFVGQHICGVCVKACKGNVMKSERGS